MASAGLLARQRECSMPFHCEQCGTVMGPRETMCGFCHAPVPGRNLPAIIPMRLPIRQAGVPVRRASTGDVVAAVVISGVTALALGKLAQWAVKRAAGNVASALLRSGVNTLVRTASHRIGPATSRSGAKGAYRVVTFVQQWVQIAEEEPHALRSGNGKKGFWPWG